MGFPGYVISLYVQVIRMVLPLRIRALALACAALLNFLKLDSCLAGAEAAALSGSWQLLVENGGVSAMHMTLTPANTVLMYDRTDYGPSQLKLAGGKCRNDPNDLALTTDCYAHAIELDLSTNAVRPLEVSTDTWCSSGAFLADGRFVSTGGWNDGGQSVRIFTPCSDKTCDWQELSNALAKPRWYASNQILPDNNIIVVGGRKGFSYEFAPRTTGAISLPFLYQTNEPNTENNLYPFLHLSSDGNVFIFANSKSILLDYRSNKVVRTFPELLGGSRNYPSSGSSVMLPLSAVDDFQRVEVMICGGAPHGAFQKVAQGSYPAALQTCARMTITDPNPEWSMENMPSSRVMGDMILLPTSEVLIINGAKQGTAGWGSAVNPSLSPFLYTPSAPTESRFQVLASTPIPRLYHSTAILLPDGRVLVGGSNPNVGYSFMDVPFPTELRIEAYSPYYLATSFDNKRPSITALNGQIGYGVIFEVDFILLTADHVSSVEFKLFAPPFTTHTTSMNQRQLILQATTILNGTSKGAGAGFMAMVKSPSSAIAAPPGYYLLFVVNQGVPSQGAWIQVVA
ncbi:hypothetical protein GOP47_0000838 [Adiantum capillus-veneris]|uniref:Galactose oxidase n=1 Tax=Adiantum capillus-veneris TaxID=13818 RepID=A0A9D4ZQW5_ADICA|nr:hypothetical protein GOP47_0000838 [Adiantum capillus-veneris]